MIIYDALYGKFNLPEFLDDLVLSPEFRRLSEVRLININSASLAALADVRRYSHTLGVLHLTLSNPLSDFGEDEHRALLAAMIMHDAGTPAFAHLFEYFLMEKYNWNHESVVPLLLKGLHHPDRAFHQIYSSQIPKFETLCRKARIDFDLVLAMVSGQHKGSSLIFGSVDFDNIDNVARMNWMLGHRFDCGRLVSLASSLSVGAQGELLIPETQRDNLQLWSDLRRKAYEILVFDAPTVAGQAVLSRAILDAIEDHTLSDEDWHYKDADLVKTIQHHSPKGKLRLERDFFGAPPGTLLMAHITDPMSPLHDRTREDLAGMVELYLSERFGVSRPYGYVFRDRGTFSKRIDARDPDTGKWWALGDRSHSLVIYGFGGPKGRRDVREQGREFEAWITAKVS